VHKNALDLVRKHPALGSHPRKRGPCSALRGAPGCGSRLA